MTSESINRALQLLDALLDRDIPTEARLAIRAASAHLADYRAEGATSDPALASFPSSAAVEEARRLLRTVAADGASTRLSMDAAVAARTLNDLPTLGLNP